MITRSVRHEEVVFDLVFDRDAIVRAALRAYIEVPIANVDPLGRHQDTASVYPSWIGDLTRGAFYNYDGSGNYDVVAWTEAGVVGLAYELGWGPIEQLGLSIEAVTGGPEDVRAAVPGLPPELEAAFAMAADTLYVGEHRERLAGVGFWLQGDRVGGSLFGDLDAVGTMRLIVWGRIRNDRLPRVCGWLSIEEIAPDPSAEPIHAIVDAVTARALVGPTELTAEEIAMLLPVPPHPSHLLGAQAWLQEVGVTWPGLLPLPEERPHRGPEPNVVRPTQVWREHPVHRTVSFDRDILVRAALHAVVENLLAKLDPQRRHPFPVCDEPNWTGDLTCGAFYNGASNGDYDVVAWTETGVIGLTYKVGFGPIEQLGLAIDSVTGGPDDVRGALPDMPSALEPALVLAAQLLRTGPHGEKLASVGFWLHDKTVAGSFFDMPEAPGASRLVAWARLGVRTLWLWPDPNNAAIEGNFALWTREPILAIVDAVVERRLSGPTELTAEEVKTLLPGHGAEDREADPEPHRAPGYGAEDREADPEPHRAPPALDAERLALALEMLRKVGIGWPGEAAIPEEPGPKT